MNCVHMLQFMQRDAQRSKVLPSRESPLKVPVEDGPSVVPAFRVAMHHGTKDQVCGRRGQDCTSFDVGEHPLCRGLKVLERVEVCPVVRHNDLWPVVLHKGRPAFRDISHINGPSSGIQDVIPDEVHIDRRVLLLLLVLVLTNGLRRDLSPV